MVVEVCDVVNVATAVVMAGMEVDTCLDFCDFLQFLPFLDLSLSAILRLVWKETNFKYEKIWSW